jgi:hypothetical protein
MPNLSDAFAPITDPNDPRLNINTPGQPGYVPPSNPGYLPVFRDLRSRYASELNDPVVAQRLYSLIHQEVGSDNPTKTRAFVETVFNRALTRGQSLAQTINDPSYYPDKSLRQVSLSPRDQTNYQHAVGDAMHGSNFANFATGNASGNVGFSGGPETTRISGEKFGIEGPDFAKLERIPGLNMQLFKPIPYDQSASYATAMAPMTKPAADLGQGMTEQQAATAKAEADKQAREDQMKKDILNAIDTLGSGFESAGAHMGAAARSALATPVNAQLQGAVSDPLAPLRIIPQNPFGGFPPFKGF